MSLVRPNRRCLPSVIALSLAKRPVTTPPWMCDTHILGLPRGGRRRVDDSDRTEERLGGAVRTAPSSVDAQGDGSTVADRRLAAIVQSSDDGFSLRPTV